MNPLFNDDEWLKRFDNHETMLRQQGKQILDFASYVFKLEEKVKELERKGKVYEEVFKRISERMVTK
jgi:hypothetical protein